MTAYALLWVPVGALLAVLVLSLLGSPRRPLSTPGGTREGTQQPLPPPVTREEVERMHTDLVALTADVAEVAALVRDLTPTPLPPPDPRCTCHQVLGHSRACAEQWPHAQPPGRVTDPGDPRDPDIPLVAPAPPGSQHDRHPDWPDTPPLVTSCPATPGHHPHATGVCTWQCPPREAHPAPPGTPAGTREGTPPTLTTPREPDTRGAPTYRPPATGYPWSE